MKIEISGKDYRRIVNKHGSVVGYASRLTNNHWCVLNWNGVRIDEAGTFEKTSQVLSWFKTYQDNKAAFYASINSPQSGTGE